MNNAAQLELAKWITGLRETAEKVNGFVLEQAPEVAREIIVLGRVWHTAALSLLLLVGMLIFWIAWSKRAAIWKTIEDDVLFGGIMAFMIAGIPTALYVVAVGYEFSHTITAWFAPRLYLIGELASLAGRAAGGHK